MGEKMTCPRRATEFGPWSREPGQDEWRTVGKDRVCSFCGSLHPEDLFNICEEAAKPDGQAEVSGCDKSYKLYASWSETKNATLGGIKFYTPHFREEDIARKDELNALIHRAIQASAVRSKARAEAHYQRLAEQFGTSKP